MLSTRLSYLRKWIFERVGEEKEMERRKDPIKLVKLGAESQRLGRSPALSPSLQLLSPSLIKDGHGGRGGGLKGDGEKLYIISCIRDEVQGRGHPQHQVPVSVSNPPQPS